MSCEKKRQVQLKAITYPYFSNVVFHDPKGQRIPKMMSRLLGVPSKICPGFRHLDGHPQLRAWRLCGCSRCLWTQALHEELQPVRANETWGQISWTFSPKKKTEKKKTWDFWSFERKVEFFEALTKKHFGILAIVWYCLDWDLTINLICCNFTDKQIAMSAINNVRRESR